MLTARRIVKACTSSWSWRYSVAVYHATRARKGHWYWKLHHYEIKAVTWDNLRKRMPGEAPPMGSLHNRPVKGVVASWDEVPLEAT